MILLRSVVECDNASMSIIICLVCSNVVTGGVMLSLGECVLFIFGDFVFVCLCMVCRFTSWVGSKSGVLSWGSLEVLFAIVLSTFDVSSVCLIVCVTCFIVLSNMSLWSASRSEFD